MTFRARQGDVFSIALVPRGGRVGLDQLTAAQTAELPAIRDAWIAIGLSTEPAERPRAEAAARLAYRRAGLAEPADIVWTGSPMAGAVLAAAVSKRRSQHLGQPLSKEIRSNVTCQVTRRASTLVAGCVASRVRREVVRQVARQVACVWGPVRHEIDRVERPRSNAGYGQHDAHWLAFYGALNRFGVDTSPLDGLTEIASACGWWWPFKNLCILTERPSRVERDSCGRLHASTGPAVVYPDGWSVYAWHGVGVDASVILFPETITLTQVHQQANTEVREVLLERYGFDRYIMETGALPFHADETGTLYRLDIGGDEPLVVVSLLNGTLESDASRKRFVLRVPPRMTHARAAAAWTFEQAAEDYRPALEK
jgi:hypothetical protein